MTSRSAVRDAVPAGAEEGLALFVYAVVPATREVPEILGLEGAPVSVVALGEVAAVVSAFDPDRSAGRRADLIAYNEVVEELSRGGAVAPVRFGSVLADEAMVVEELLGPQEGVFADLLADLDGRHQFNLRATYVEEVVLREVVGSDPEVRALRERTKDLPEELAYGDRVQLGELVARGVDARRADDAMDLMDVVEPLVATSADRGRPDADTVLDVALLVDDDRVEELEQRLEELAEAVHERIRLRLVGPLAPFDFAGGT